MFLGLQKLLDVRQQDVTGRKQTSAEPQQLPALLLTVPAHKHHDKVNGAQTEGQDFGFVAQERKCPLVRNI